MCGVALLSGILGVVVAAREKNPRYQTLFFLLAVWLLWTGSQELLQKALTNWVFDHSEKSFYAIEFNHMMWALTALLASGYILVDSIFRKTPIGGKCGLSILGVVLLWGLLWLPFLQDPEHLYQRPLVRDFVAVDELVSQGPHSASSLHDAGDISRRLTLPRWDGIRSVGVLGPGENLVRIKEILDYLDGPEDYVLMVLRPLNTRDGWAALFSVIFIGTGLGFRIVRDRPESAFVEKILMLLLLTWVYEALHAFSFTAVRSTEVFASIYDIGFCISAFLYLVLGYLFSRRLDFITSIEGQYYEHVLQRDAGSVTRWIDRFDLFILDKFLGHRGPLRRLFTTKDNRLA
jgi:hypothetical protein